MIEISPETRTRIQALYPLEQLEEVEAFLASECGDNLPLVDTNYVELAERIRFAVLKLSQGDFADLQKSVRNASIDRRDTLTTAGFGDDTNSLLQWHPE